MNNREFYRQVAKRVKEGGTAEVYTILEDAQRPSWERQKAFRTKDGLYVQSPETEIFWKEFLSENGIDKFPQNIDWKGTHILAENFVKKPQLVICGGGHIGAPLASLGNLMGFDVTVIDDRPEFANRERFPKAEKIFCSSFEDALDKVSGSQTTYFVIITHGHLGDMACLERILTKPSAYVGMIGSRKKVAAVKEKILEKGFSEALWEKVHTPIGLRIGAQTPAEIAICIAAEIIQIRRQEAVEGDLGDEMLERLENSQEPMVLATVVKKIGSAPRSTGAKMLVLEKGTILGSVGGGAGEASVCKIAGEIMQNGGSCLVSCDMTNKNVEQRGMVCGGKIQVCLEKI